MLDFLDDYNWKEVFEYAESPAITPDEWDDWKTGGSGKTFTREDVKEIIAFSVGENDGPDWLMILRLNNDDYAYIMAGCDYSGWWCRASGKAYVASSLAALVRWAIAPEERERLGFIPGI